MCRLLWIAIAVLTCASSAWAQDPTDDSPYDFALTRALLEDIVGQKTFLPQFKVRILHRSNIKTPAEDCEVHLASEFQGGAVVGDPEFLVVEPPNLCKFFPGATNPTPQLTKVRAAWRSLLDARVLNKNCTVTGFPRIYTEHAAGEPSPSNPNHVFEVHPATSITCGGGDALQFTKFFRGFPDLRRIKPESAEDCLASVQLWVRFHKDEDHYEFFERKSPKCGNLAIIEAGSVPREWIRKTGGGHTAIGRVTADGGTRRTLKLYAVEGTTANEWLERRLAGKKASPSDPRMLHGFLTYDYFSIFRALEENGTGGQWYRGDKWVSIRFPMAFVILGPTDVVPWEEQ